MNKVSRLAAVISLVFCLGCIAERDGWILVVIESDVPDTTSADQITLEGTLQRTPERQFLITWVTVTGGLITAVDTANSFQQFSVTVPLNADAVNNLSLTAEDETGAVTTAPWTTSIVHVSAPPE